MWIDEAKTALVARGEGFQGGREFLQVLFYKLWGDPNLLMLRIPIIIASSLTAAFLYRNANSFVVAVVVALHPFFVHWGTLARPYALAGLFIVLAFRSKWFYIPAILATPFAIIGLNWYKAWEQKWFYLFLIISAVIWYNMMPLSESNHFRLEFLYEAKRLWHIPVISLLAHLVYIEQCKLSWIQLLYKRLVGSD
jgi:hypothetical protein